MFLNIFCKGVDIFFYIRERVLMVSKYCFLDFKFLEKSEILYVVYVIKKLVF